MAADELPAKPGRRMMQPTLPQMRLYNIVPDSGLQFLDFGFSSEDVEKVRCTFAELASEQETVLSPLRARSDGSMETFQGEPVQVDENAFTVKFPDALDVFSNAWLPLPFLKQRGGGRSGQRFEEGPTNWVRFRITPLEEKDENGYNHRLTLLIDTSTGDRDLLQSYVMPLREDVENEAVFGFACDVGQNAWLLKEAWMEQWLNQHLERYEGEARLPRQDRVPRKTAGWAMFVTLLEGLNKSGFEPQVKLVDTVSEGASQRAIDVDLVLDIGNCRTCGVLIEKRPSESGRLDLKNAQPLRLRDFTDPVQSYADPFPRRNAISGTKARRPGPGCSTPPRLISTRHRWRFSEISDGICPRRGTHCPSWRKRRRRRWNPCFQGPRCFRSCWSKSSTRHPCRSILSPIADCSSRKEHRDGLPASL
jgi:hypothetical protein